TAARYGADGRPGRRDRNTPTQRTPMEFIPQHTDNDNRIQTYRAEHKDGTCFQVALGFGTKRHDLNRAQISTILGTLKFLKGEDMILEMYGEADPQGEPGYNMMLSEKRMRTVQRLMVNHGVPREKVFVPALCKALGEFFENARRRPEKDPY